MKNDGGPAFPGGPHPDNRSEFRDGMSLRDYFAGQALVGVMLGQAVAAMQGKDFDAPEADAAEACYALADAMIEARSQPERGHRTEASTPSTGDDDGE